MSQPELNYSRYLSGGGVANCLLLQISLRCAIGGKKMISNRKSFSNSQCDITAASFSCKNRCCGLERAAAQRMQFSSCPSL